MARIVISKSPEKLLALAKKILKKHEDDGAASPLKTLLDANWTDNGPKVAEADDLNAQAKELEKKVEKLYQDRDALLTSVELTVRASANLLNGIYKNSPKNLGEWGFEVNDTPAKKKTDTPKP